MRRRWLVVATLASLIAVSIVLLLPRSRAWQRRRLSSIAARAPFRVIPGRLGNFEHRPLYDAREERRTFALLRLRGDAGQYSQSIEDDRLRGDALILTGDPDRAIALLQRAAAERGDAQAWSDLAVALFERGTSSGSAELVIDSLAAAQKGAELDPFHAAAHFNAAMALEALGLTSEAGASFATAARLDQGSAWSEEASQRARSLASRDPSVEWSSIEQRLLDGGSPRLAAEMIERESGTARRVAEWTYLTDWAAARLDGQSAKAQTSLNLARVVARALLDAHRERLLTDAIAAIDRAEAGGTASVLAKAHLAYDEGRDFLRGRDAARALERFDEAATSFARAGSPMEYLAQYYASGALYSQSQIDAALAKVARVESLHPERRGYRALAAQLGWHQGVCLVVRGRHADAVNVFSRSRALAFEIRDALLAAQFDGLAAEALEYLGQTAEAWRLRTSALRALSSQANDQRKTVTLMTAANLQLAHREWRRCVTLLDQAVPLALKLRDPVLATHTLAQRAIAHEELGDAASGAADRDRAAIWLQKIGEPAMHQRLTVELEVARGVAVRASSPRLAVDHFDRAIQQFLQSGELAHLPRLHLERGRSFQALGQVSEQRSDLAAALALIDSWGEGVEDAEKRASLNVWSETIRRDAIDLELRAGDPGAAFALADGGRWAGHGMSLREVSGSLASDAAIVEFVLTPRGMVAFVVRRDAARAVLLPASVEAITAAADRVRTSRPDGPSELYRLAMAPIQHLLAGASTLLVVPEREISGVPFGALVDQARGRLLIEDFAVLHAPSVASAIVASRKPRAGAERVLVVGANDFEDSALDALPSVDREARAVAAQWPGSTLLLGTAVTTDVLRRELPRATVVHHAGHNVGRASGSQLVLSDGVLLVHDIAGMDLRETRVVVLAACRGAGSKSSHSILTDTASAFLLAGSQAVVASAVDVNDEQSPAIMSRLHSFLAEDTDAAKAVQRSALAERQTTRGDLPSAHLMVIGGSPALLAPR